MPDERTAGDRTIGGRECDAILLAWLTTLGVRRQWLREDFRLSRAESAVEVPEPDGRRAVPSGVWLELKVA
jgi:hypothetical protein